MPYDTIKNGIVERLNGLELKESKEAFDFESTSERQYNKTFVINPVDGETNDEFSTLLSQIHDVQTWVIKLAFKKDSRSETYTRDKMQRIRESIISDLDDPTNWQSFASELRYDSWEVEDVGNYFLLTINIRVIDRITY